MKKHVVIPTVVEESHHNKLRTIFILFIFLLGAIYLTLPSPGYPELSSGIRSDEPGDTWQNPDQKGYYTNSGRAEVLSDIQSQFVVRLGDFSVPSYRLNYRPEEAYQFVRDQLSSYYLEEIIYPLRESIFVNGWDPKRSPLYAGRPLKEIPNISFLGIPYNSKVTLKPVTSPVWARLLVWTLVFPATYLVYQSIKKSIDKNA